MYQTIREYQVDKSAVTEILSRDEKTFVPFISNAPGFREYTCTDTGNGVVTSTSVFASRSEGDMFNTQAGNWVKQNLGSLIPGAPRVTSGEIRVHATGKVLAS